MATKQECRNNKNYWWNQYDKFRKNYSQIKKIRDNVDQSGCVKDVNNKIKKCVEYMEKALQGSSKFSSNCYALEQKKLGFANQEYKLSQAQSYLSAEMSRLSSKENNAYSNYEYWKRKEREAED